MSHPRQAARALTIGTLCLSLAACSRGCSGETEMAFCDAVNRNDAAAAKTIFDAGQIDMLARDFSGRCQPGLRLVQRAVPQLAEFTAMAVTFVKREGVADTCWITSKGTGGAGCAITIAARNVNPAVMRALVAAGVDVKNQKARGALSDAAIQGSLETVTILVEAGTDPGAAITAAVSYRQQAIVEYLESKGAREDVDPLLVAARRGDATAVDAAIAARANLEVTDGAGRTPLMRAALYGHAAVVARLAKAGAKVDAATPEDHHTALHIAANENNVDVVEALAAAKANMNARADAGSPTPLLVAVENGAEEAVRALLAAGADANVFTDNTAVNRAIERGNLAMVKALVAAGARVNEPHGRSWQAPILPLLGICGQAPEGDGENDYYRVTLMKAVVAAGADGKARDAKGQTPIETVSELLAGAEGDFYKACYQAKLDYLKTL